MPYNHPQVITIQKGVDGPVPGREDMTMAEIVIPSFLQYGFFENGA